VVVDSSMPHNQVRKETTDYTPIHVYYTYYTLESTHDLGP
jgi:hypothetical protein